MSNTRGNAKTKSEEVEVSSDDLAKKMAAFLKKGGKVEKVPTGKSGQQNISYFRRSTAANRKPPSKPSN